MHCELSGLCVVMRVLGIVQTKRGCVLIIATLSLTIALAISAENTGQKCPRFLHEVDEHDRRVLLGHAQCDCDDGAVPPRPRWRCCLAAQAVWNPCTSAQPMVVAL